MKKFILLLSTRFIVLGVVAQERVVSNTILSDGTYLDLTSKLTSADVFKATTNDTTDYVFKYTGGYVNKVAIRVNCQAINGADTLSVQLLGYDFFGDTTGDVIIAAATTTIASGGTANIVLTDDYMSAADEFSFRFYKIRVIHLGVGNGCLAKGLEIKLYN
jgi:hypothetical protein